MKVIYLIYIDGPINCATEKPINLIRKRKENRKKLWGPNDISMEELELALRTAKNRKAVGSDQIPVEMREKLSQKVKKYTIANP